MKTYNKKICPHCEHGNAKATKQCTSCGFDFKQLKYKIAYDPYKMQPRCKEEIKIYKEVGDPLGPHRKVGDVTTVKKLIKTHSNYPNEGLVLNIEEKKIWCSFCECNVITAKQRIECHLVTKKHIRNKGATNLTSDASDDASDDEIILWKGLPNKTVIGGL